VNVGQLSAHSLFLKHLLPTHLYCHSLASSLEVLSLPSTHSGDRIVRGHCSFQVSLKRFTHHLFSLYLSPALLHSPHPFPSSLPPPSPAHHPALTYSLYLPSPHFFSSLRFSSYSPSLFSLYLRLFSTGSSSFQSFLWEPTSFPMHFLQSLMAWDVYRFLFENAC